MAAPVVQHSSLAMVTFPVNSGTMATTSASGNLLVVFCYGPQSTGAVSVSDGTNTYTAANANPIQEGSNATQMFVWWTVNATTNPTVTFSYPSTTSNLLCGYCDVSGAAASSFIDQQHGVGSIDATYLTNSVTTTNNTDLIIALAASAFSGAAYSTGAGYSVIQSNTVTRDGAIATATPALGATNPAWTNANGGSGGVSFTLAIFPPAYSFVHDSAACSSTAVSTLSTPAITVTAGNFLIAAACTQGGNVTSISDGPGDTFTFVDNASSLWVYVCPSAIGGSTSVTFNFSVASGMQVYLAEYSGLGQSLAAVLSHSNVSNHSGTSFTGGPVSTALAPAMLWSMCLDNSSDAVAPICAGGLTARTTALWACNSPFQLNAVGDRLLSTAGSFTSGFTLGTQFDAARIVTMAIATFGAVPSTPPLQQLFYRRNQLFFST